MTTTTTLFATIALLITTLFVPVPTTANQDITPLCQEFTGIQQQACQAQQWDIMCLYNEDMSTLPDHIIINTVYEDCSMTCIDQSINQEIDCDID
jgi:hypothetical protein